MKSLQEPIFQALFNSPVPRIIVRANAPEFTIVISNDAHKLVTNLVGRDIDGKSVWETFDPAEAGGDGGKLLFDALFEAQATNKTVLMPPFRYDMGALDGNGMVEKWWQLEIMPIGGDAGSPDYLLTTTNDITDQIMRERQAEDAKKALHDANLHLEEEVAKRTEELSRAFEQVTLSKHAAQLGTFDMDLLKGTMEWDSRCRELFGISHDNEVSYDQDFLTGLYPDDKERVENLIRNLFDRSKSNGDYDVEYRTVGAENGRLRWVRAKGKVYFNEGDRPVRFIGSVLDITDKKNEEELRNGFISMASHELKTPLTSLQGYLQLLKKKFATEGDAFTRSALSSSERQIRKMSDIISGFLNMSRLESGKFQLTLKPIELSQHIATTIQEFKLLNPGVNIQFQKEQPVQVDADAEKLEHVLVNLLSNAVKYSKKGTTISVSYVVYHDSVAVSVKDDGVGIHKNDLGKLFDRFYRSENAKDQHISGFGIGLYLCYEIVRLHGGNIEVESEPGKGSTFRFTLRRKA